MLGGLFREKIKVYNTCAGYSYGVNRKETYRNIPGDVDHMPDQKYEDQQAFMSDAGELAKSLLDEPTFAWWVRDTLSTRNRIISKVKSRYWKQTHKFGICIPKTVAEALKIDNKNGNHFWKDAIEKEMLTVRPASHILLNKNGDAVMATDYRANPTKYLPAKYNIIDCHFVFDIMPSWVRK